MEILNHDEGTKFPLSRVLRERALALLRAKTSADGLIPYGELSDALGLDVQADKRGRHAVLTAGRLLLREDNKKLVNVRDQGYQIVEPKDHVAVSQGERKRARRWLRRSLETVTHIALDELPPNEVAKVLQEQARVAIVIGVERKLGRQKVLPERSQVALPSATRLVEMFKKKAG